MDRTGRRYTQFKNFKNYSNSVIQNEKLFDAYEKIKNSTRSNNLLKSKTNDIKIDETWVKTIEYYLPFVSAAINENRKFIKNNAETVPVEKAKKVSRETVIDLAVNSQNIRKVKEDDEIEPSKLLIVEKLDDYTVYENKFLVYLLKLIKSFIEIRFDKIREAKSLYESDTKLKDTVNLFRNKISYSIEIKDQRYGDLNLEENDKNTNIIRRIQNCQIIVNQLLRTDLIETVSRSPSIRLPIQRTNVLKNDPNFSKCLAFYDFIASYAGDGFEIIKNEKIKDKLSEEYLNYFSKIPTLIAFLSFAETKDVYGAYEKEYLAEQEDFRKIQLKIYAEKLKELLGKNELDIKTVYEYIKMIEEEKISLEKTILDNEVKHKQEIESLEEKHTNEINALNQAFASEKEEIRTAHLAEITRLNNEFNETKVALETELSKAKEKVLFYEKAISALEGRITALQIALNPNFEEDKIDERYFDLLEKQKDAFDKYFKEKRKKVKKEIVKNRKKEAVESVKQARIDKKSRKKQKKEEKEKRKLEKKEQKKNKVKEKDKKKEVEGGQEQETK